MPFSDDTPIIEQIKRRLDLVPIVWDDPLYCTMTPASTRRLVAEWEAQQRSLARLAAIDRAAAIWEAARLGRVAWPNGDEYEALFDAEEALREAIAGRGLSHG